jgi:prostaglandin-endoperoxide synthase 2
MSFIDPILKFAARVPVLDRSLNRHFINHFANTTVARPRPFSLWSSVPVGGDPTVPEYITDYTSWPGLTNKRYSGRHLPPAASTYTAGLPADAPYEAGKTMGNVTALFARKGEMTPSRSSLLFMFFAQWFTDSVLRVHPIDRRMNTSNHDIDLCQIYGLTEDIARALRTMTGGKLRSQLIHGEEYLDYLGTMDAQGNYTVKPEYATLPAAVVGVDNILAGFTGLTPDRREKLYATGLERGNSSVGYVAISTIFMREHNRICDELAKNNPAWSDERLFQTARNINIVLLLKLVIEDYINHILGHKLFVLDHEFAEEEHWYRPNWIAIEFDLLYRWHGLAPDQIAIGAEKIHPKEFRNNNALLEEFGVGTLVQLASSQAAGKIGLSNTPDYLWEAEYRSLKMSRDFRLRPYNDYREQFGLPRLLDFTELTSDLALRGKLEELYGDIDNLEYVVGIFAEEAEEGLLFGDLLNRMVACDAFTQIFSNPLLSRNVYGPATFTQYGLDLIEQTTSIEVLVNRNVKTPVSASLGV